MRMYKEAARKTYERSQEVTELVGSIIENVKLRGDQELLELTKKFDGIDMDTVRVGREEIEKAYSLVSGETIEAIKNAAAQIRFFAGKQLECMTPLTTASPVAGVTLGHRLIPVETVGAYVPAGRYPLPSTALMLAIPAKVAGVKRVLACSQKDTEPFILLFWSQWILPGLMRFTAQAERRRLLQWLTVRRR